MRACPRLLPALAVLLAFAFAGCAQQEEALQPVVAGGVAVLGEETQAPQPLPETMGGNASQNGTQYVPPPLDEAYDPFSNATLRNVTDRIMDGQFRIADEPETGLEIYAISAGQADSILVKKGGFSMLVDAGNSDAAAEFLKGMGITRLDVIVATRDYGGAVGGMPGIFAGFSVGEFWDNGAPASSAEYAAVMDAVDSGRITVKHPVAGDRMSVNGLEVSILNPQKQRLLDNPDNDAIVMKLRYGEFCAVLLNPTIQERESALMNGQENLDCDVATYFRHGEGRPAPSLLIENRIMPKDVIISVGQNREKLPSQTTLERLALGGMKVWRTDAGTVKVSSDGAGYQISRVS